MYQLLNPNQPLFTQARSGYRLPKSWLETVQPTLDKLYPIIALGLAVLFVLIAQLFGGIIAVGLMLAVVIIQGGELPSLDMPSHAFEQAIRNLVVPDTALETAIFLIFLFGPIFLILAIWLSLFEKRQLWSLGMTRYRAVWYYLRGGIVGFVMFTTAIGILAVMGFVDVEAGSAQSQGLTALDSVLIVFFGWLVQGAAEEVLTRGWLLSVIGSRYNVLIGILLSSSLFAILHLLNPSVSLIAMLNLFLFGLFAALYALYEESLWGVFSIHSVWNWVQGNIYGFEVSGNIQLGGTLIDLMEVGPDYLTGGAFGPEGGLVVTGVLVISCFIVWGLSLRKPVLNTEQFISDSTT